MSAPWFRTTDFVRWGASNSGGDLSAVQFDENTWWNYTHITALEARPIPVNIDHFTLVGNLLTVVMEDHSQLGPYEIPTSAFNWRGDWLPDTAYLVNDVFTANGQIYISIFNHTSQSTFNAGANDGLGHNYYALMLSAPGNALPTGGAVGQMLSKSTTDDFAVTWEWPLPTGGTVDQILMMNSNTNQDASWRTAPFVWTPPVSPPGSAGQFLQTVDGTSTNTVWADASGGGGGIAVPPASPGGGIGQGFVSTDGTTTSIEWAWLYGAPDSSGDPDQVPVSVDGTISNVSWRDYRVSGLVDYNQPFTPAASDRLRWNASIGKWENRGGICFNEGIVTSNVTVEPLRGGVMTITVANNITLDNSAREGGPGDKLTIVITTTGTTSFNVSFSSGDWIGQGTLATGTVSGKIYVLSFVPNDTGKLIEISRIGPF